MEETIASIVNIVFFFCLLAVFAFPVYLMIVIMRRRKERRLGIEARFPYPSAVLYLALVAAVVVWAPNNKREFRGIKEGNLPAALLSLPLAWALWRDHASYRKRFERRIGELEERAAQGGRGGQSAGNHNRQSRPAIKETDGNEDSAPKQGRQG